MELDIYTVLWKLVTIIVLDLSLTMPSESVLLKPRVSHYLTLRSKHSVHFTKSTGSACMQLKALTFNTGIWFLQYDILSF